MKTVNKANHQRTAMRTSLASEQQARREQAEVPLRDLLAGIASSVAQDLVPSTSLRVAAKPQAIKAACDTAAEAAADKHAATILDAAPTGFETAAIVKRLSLQIEIAVVVALTADDIGKRLEKTARDASARQVKHCGSDGLIEQAQEKLRQQAAEINGAEYDAQIALGHYKQATQLLERLR